MIPTERRVAILKLIADIDQDLAEADSLAQNKRLLPSERNRARVWREFYRSAARQAERLLAEPETR